MAGVIANEPGEEPSTRDIADTCDLVTELGIRTLFVEPQYPQKAAETIARETGASIYTLDPCVSGDGTKESYEIHHARKREGTHGGAFQMTQKRRFSPRLPMVTKGMRM